MWQTPAERLGLLELLVLHVEPTRERGSTLGICERVVDQARNARRIGR